MKKSESYIFIALLIIIPILIYLQFRIVRVNTISGDDLVGYQEISAAGNLKQIIALATSVDKFRPVSGPVTKALMLLFHKNLASYYFFNVTIQTINTFLIAAILNLFLRMPLLSLFVSLIYGLIRFSFYTLSQLFYGGGLEGLAMTFFLSALFFLLRAAVRPELPRKQVLQNMLLSLLFANLAIYTHERYIVFFPFIILMVLLFPGFRSMGSGAKTTITLLAVASIAANVLIKKYVYSMPFFVGTGSTNISFSFSTAIGFLGDAILCIFQINAGNQGHTGKLFSELPLLQKGIVAILTLGIIFILFRYTRYAFTKYRTLDAEQKAKANIFISLFFLAGFCLAPAIVTIRLEQRWLQASFAIFLIMVVIALSSLPIKTERNKYLVFSAFTICFLAINANYFYKGKKTYYLNSAQYWAAIFEHGVKKKVIRPDAGTLYIYSKHPDGGFNDFINWSLGGGYFFDFYQTKSKKLTFIDSAYVFSADPFKDFTKDSAQVVYIKDAATFPPLPSSEVIDITAEFQKDSLKSFTAMQP